MELMSKMSCGIIYAAKMSKDDAYTSISHFMSNYTNTPIEYYTHNIIENLLSSAISDLLNHMKYPSGFWSEYCHYKQYPWKMNDFYAMCAALSSVQVREGELYLNGFRPIEQFEF